MLFIKNFIISVPGLCLLLALTFTTGCTPAFLARKGHSVRPEDIVHIGRLIACAYEAARKEISKKDPARPAHSRYMDELVADGRLTVGLGIGTEDLGRVFLPQNAADYISSNEYVIRGKKVLIEGRLILTKDDFRKALAECEIIFITSHSRFGAGPVFLQDGKAKPYRMQRTKDYEIVMPQSEVSGYQGTVKRTYNDPLKRKTYVVFEPDSTDLNRAGPLNGCQILVLSTCSSKKHFLDEITEFRAEYPTAAVFTTRAGCMDTSFSIFKRFLFEVFQEKTVDEVVAGMNEEYTAVAWKNVKKRIPPWKVIKDIYVVGLNNLPE